MKGKPAKRCTTAEWMAFMRVVVQKARQLEQTQAWRDTCGARAKVIFSADNATVHGDATTHRQLGIDATEWMQCPARSPDFHKVIEHLFARMKEAFSKWFHSHPAPREMSEYMAKVQELFVQCAKPETIREDVDSMFDTYWEIIKAKGGWPPKPFR